MYRMAIAMLSLLLVRCTSGTPAQPEPNPPASMGRDASTPPLLPPVAGSMAADARVEPPLDAGAPPPRQDAGSPPLVVDASAPPAEDSGATEAPRIGAVLADDSSVWCMARVSGAKRAELEVFLRRVPSDAAAEIEAPYRFAQGRAIGRMTCTEREDGGGEQASLETDPSNDDDDDVARARCPDATPFGRNASCELIGHDEAAPGAAVELRFVHLPASVADDEVPYADGSRCIGSIRAPRVHGQTTGFVQEYMDESGAVARDLPLENEALMRTAQIGGTDEGAPFLAQGKLWFVFGDTTAFDSNEPVSVGFFNWRSNVLAYTEDFDVRDGFRFDGFETGAAAAGAAAERVISPHDQVEAEGSEFTAIPLAGFGFTSADGHRYRFLWYVSIHKWSAALVGPDFEANYSSLAVAVDDEPNWTRVASPPSPPGANFGPGTVWFDRFHRWLYFFGITPDRGAIRLARVRSTFDRVMDPHRYEFWTGEGWAPGDPSAAIPVIEESASYAPRSEISVAFNPAAQVWMMMLVNWYAAPSVTPANQVEVWQAPAITGPWKKVDADAQLPNGNRLLQYGPMLNEHLLLDGGLEVHYLLSQFFPVYNVHHHSYRIDVMEGDAAAACPR